MIPKIIHMCWFGGNPYPWKIQYCIDSWKRILPDYEVMLWDEERFDVGSLAWTREAYDAGKYAFVADYVRFYAMYNYGGIYMDCDVEVIRSFDDLLGLPYFVGNEACDSSIELAAFGAEKGLEWVKYAMDHYVGRHFIKENGERDMLPIPFVMMPHLSRKYDVVHIGGLSEFDPDPSRICVLPLDWFNAHPWEEGIGKKYVITENTRCIHHFANSWTEDKFVGGPLHRLYYWITGKDWKLRDKRFRLYGTDKKRNGR